MNKQPKIIILIALIFCAAFSNKIFAQCDSVNADLSNKIRYLGGWDSNGRPDNLEADKDTVSDEIMDFINTVLPEGVNITDSGYFDEDVQPNTELQDTAKVYVTFVHEGAAWNNAFGFYTYDIDNPPDSYEDIDSLTVIFPNVDSVSAIKAGEQVYLGEFMPNTGIGYFLISQGWKGDTVCLGRYMIFSDKRLNTFTSPKYPQQSILLNNELDGKLLLGIEDQLRPSGDKDFNDIIFNISVTPEDAVDTTDIPKIPTAHISGDTVLCEPDDEATIKVKLTGSDPWTIVYNNGSEDITIENIQDTVYTFQTTAKDTISLVSVQDNDGYGIVSGSAIVQLAGTEAYFEAEDMALCESTAGKAKVNLNGFGPYDIKYTDGEDTTLLTGITDDFVEIDVEAGATYTLFEVRDRYCSKLLEDSLEVFESAKPLAEVTGGGVVCEQTEKLDALINFEGAAPFTFIYEIEGENDTVTTSSNPLAIPIGVDSTLTPIAISDANCTGEVSGSASVTYSSEIKATLTGIDTAFCESDSAALKISFEGVAPYIFEISNGEWSNQYETDESEFIIYVDQPGIYQITSFSNANCQGSGSGEVEVTLHQGPSATVSGGGAICEDGETADALVTFEGPGPYNFVYDLNGERDTAVYSSSSADIALQLDDELIPFTVYNNTCAGTVSGSASTYPAQKPEVSLSQTGEICGNDEEINVTISFSGKSPFTYKYLLNEEEFEATTSENSLNITLSDDDSLKSISLEDANCRADLDINSDYNVVYHQSPTATISGSSNICDGSLAEITISFTGNAPWTTEIKNGTFSEVITSNDAEYIYETDLTGTFELVSVTDAHCDGQVSGEATIGEFEKPTATLNKVGEICGDDEEISVELTFAGTAPFNYQYQLNGQTFNASSSDDIVEIVLGNNDDFKLLSFEDAHCTGTIDSEDDFHVIYHHSPTATISGSTNICDSEMAKITIQFTGNAPWTTEIKNGDFSEMIVSNEQEFTYETNKTGTFTLDFVSDAHCDGQVSGEATIGEFEKPTAELTGETAFCENSSAILTVSLDGEPPFSFQISNGNTTTDYTTSETEFNAEVNEGGTYFISYIEDAHCTGNASGNVDVTMYETPTAHISGGGSFCSDEMVDIQIDFTGEAPFTFTYTDGEEHFEATTSESSYTFETNNEGTYTLESVSDAHCDGAVTGEAVVSNILDDLDASINAADNFCEKDPIELSASIDGSFETLEWSSNGSGSFTSTSDLDTEYIPAEGESGTITIFVDITTECGIKQISKDIEIIPTPNAIFDVANDELFTGDEITFDPETDDYDSYEWDYGDNTNGTGNPGQHIYDDSGIYTVSLTVTDRGCTNDAEVAIEIILNDQLYVPNVFNPDAQHPENRVVKVYGSNVSEQDFSFKIVNRWGNTMYETTSFNEANSKGWNGHEMNNDEMQALSSFTYILKGKFDSGETFEKTGTITLLR